MSETTSPDDSDAGTDGGGGGGGGGGCGGRPAFVTVLGGTELLLPTAAWNELDVPTERVAGTVDCATGGETRGQWSGIPLLELFEAVRMPDETTHLLVSGADGFRCCPEIAAVVGGILAFERSDVPHRSAGVPRLVADGLEGTRMVRRVTRLEGVSLDAGRDRSSLESF